MPGGRPARRRPAHHLVRRGIAENADCIPAAEPGGYGAVVPGPSAGAGERDAGRRAFTAAGVDVPRVEGLAPVVPLLVDRTEQALDAGPSARHRLTDLTVYRVDRLSRTRTRDVVLARAGGTVLVTAVRR